MLWGGTAHQLSIGPVRDRLKVYRRRYFAPAPYAQKHAVDASQKLTHTRQRTTEHPHIVIDTRTHITHDEPSAASRPRRGRAHSSAPRGRRAPSLQSTLIIAAPQGHSGRNRKQEHRTISPTLADRNTEGDRKKPDHQGDPKMHRNTEGGGRTHRNTQG